MPGFQEIARFLQILGYVGLFSTVAPLFPFLYVVVRWRAGGRHEPGIGTCGAVLYFATVSVLLALAGAANLTYGWISTTPTDEVLTRFSWGMFTGSLVFLAVNGVVLRRLPHVAEQAEARRVFLGFLMVMAGLVAITVLVLFFVTVFATTESEEEAIQRVDDLKLYGAWTAYYLGTYLLTAWRMSRVAGIGTDSRG